jgi:hypothetical protein
MGARNRVGTELSYRPARQHSLAELVPWNRFLGSLKVKNPGSEVFRANSVPASKYKYIIHITHKCITSLRFLSSSICHSVSLSPQPKNRLFRHDTHTRGLTAGLNCLPGFQPLSDGINHVGYHHFTV